MNWNAIGALGEIFGGLAVVLSLVYVAAQLRQNTQALRRAASADAISAIRHWNDALIRDPEVGRIFTQGLTGIDSLSEADRIRFLTLMVNFFKTYEDLYYQYANGAMDPEVWAGWEQLGVMYFNTVGMRQYWNERRPIFSASFQRWMDSISDLPPAERNIAEIASAGVTEPPPGS